MGRRHRCCRGALDRKSIRGAQKFGEKVHLLSLVRHEPSVILAQVEGGEKEKEISAAPALLAEVNLRHNLGSTAKGFIHHGDTEDSEKMTRFHGEILSGSSIFSSSALSVPPW